MHGEAASLWHEVVHHSENTLLHLASILCAKDGKFLFFEVYSNRCLAGNILCRGVSVELSSIHDSEVDSLSEVSLELIDGCTNEHVLHEQGMIGSGGDDSASKSVVLVPASISVDNEKL